MTPSVKACAAAAVIALALATGACGDDSDDDAADPGEAATELRVTVDEDGDGPDAPAEASLSCPEEAGPAAEVSAACAAASELSVSDADPIPPDTACTKIYGGPDVVTLEGTLAGEEIDAQLNRQGGCEIERFDRFAVLIEALFPDYEPGGPPKA